uniref:Uncharacterized protein n=1 Tax=Bombyx mori TaxID=7091 RepID=A0A8R2LU67_BOMMO|nr:uncharacterized protein LOC101744902 isoform X2 [Bombyx mori]XP_037866525.1 uncharacterized protein LOC101744902 isoform X2 [Bombyx mori]
MASPDPPLPTHYIQILEPAQEPTGTLRDRLNQLSACEINTKVTYDVCSVLSPPRNKILELLRPEDPGRDALEAIVRPIPRRGLTRPLDEDTKRFLHRALQPPSTYRPETTKQEPKVETKTCDSNAERSLAEELREAEEDVGKERKHWLRDFRKRGESFRGAAEREQMGKLALSVEDDEEEDGLSAAARKIDALLAESRELHEELAGIHEDLQVLARRVARRDAL